MARFFAFALVLFLLGPSPADASPNGAGTVSVELRERRLAPGTHLVIVSVYATEQGGEPLATETRTVLVEKSGTFILPLDALPEVAGGRWLAVRVPPGVESRRIPLARNGQRAPSSTYFQPP